MKKSGDFRFKYEGRDSEFPVHRLALDEIRKQPNATDAIALYVVLVDMHGHTWGKTFNLSHEGMRDSGLLPLSRDRFRKARNALEAAGVLSVAKKYSVGKFSTQFCLSHLIVDEQGDIRSTQRVSTAKRSKPKKKWERKKAKASDDIEFIIDDD